MDLDSKLEHSVMFPCVHCQFLGKQVESTKRCQSCDTNLCDNCIFTHSPNHKLVALETGPLSHRAFSTLSASRQSSVLSRNSFVSIPQELTIPPSRQSSVASLSARPNITSGRTSVNSTRRNSVPLNRRNSAATLVRRSSLTTAQSRRSSIRGLEECLLHGLTLEVFCISHDQLCCEDCVTSIHGGCDVVLPITEAAKGIRDKTDYRELAEKIESRKVHCQQLKKDREGVLENMTLQDEKFVKSVQEFRLKINETLDELEASILKEKEMLVESEAMEGQSQVKTCDTAISVLDGASRQLEAAAKANDEQLFIAVKSITSTLEKCDGVISGMDMQETTSISFDFTPNMELEFVENIGELNINSSYLHNREGVKRMWILKPMGEFPVKMSTDTGICNITGSVALDNGKFVFADQANQCLRVIGADHKPRARIALSSFPWDVCAISSSLVAVTLPKVESVQIVSVEGKMRIENTLKLKHACRGIAYYDGYLYLTCSTQGTPHIKVITDGGAHMRKLQPKKGILFDPHYIKIDPKDGTLFISDWKKGVVALDQKGYLIFSCLHPNAVCYWDITLDKYNQVYIISKDPNTICRVSPDQRRLVPIQIWPEQRSVTFLSLAYNNTSDTLLLSVDGPTGDTIRTFKIS